MGSPNKGFSQGGFSKQGDAQTDLLEGQYGQISPLDDSHH